MVYYWDRGMPNQGNFFEEGCTSLDIAVRQPVYFATRAKQPELAL